MSRTIGRRSVALNMRSVRQSPIPIAPYFNARAASSGVSALAITLRREALSAHSRSVTSSGEKSASTIGTEPA